MWFFLLTIIANRTLFTSKFFPVHDTTNVARIIEMNRSIRAGEFPVRWSENFGFGYGMPLFSFYAPLPYYVAQIPLFFGFTGIESLKFLYLLSTVLACGSMYLWAKKMWGTVGAILSASVFTFSTYRAVDLFVRGAIGEVFAMSLLPLLLYSVHVLFEYPKRGGPLLAVSLAGILLSHNLIGMISIGLAGMYGLFLFLLTNISTRKSIPTLRTMGVLGVLCSSIVAGLCLCAFYVFPAYGEKDVTRVEETITTGYFDYHNHYVAIRQFFLGKWGYGGSQPGLEDGISFAYGFAVLFLLFISFVTIAWWGKRKDKYVFGLCLGLFLFFSFMTTNKSTIIWDAIGLLKFLQFPWRFLVFSHVFLAGSIGGAAVYFHRYVHGKVIVTCLLLAAISSNAKIYVPENYLADDSRAYDASAQYIRESVSKTLNDYMPKAIKGDSWPRPADARIVPTMVGSTVQIENNKPARLSGTMYCPEECRYTINIFQFPTWRMVIDGIDTPLQQALHLPVYEVVVPKGNHTFTLFLTDTPLRRVSNVVSLFSILALFAYTIHLRRMHA